MAITQYDGRSTAPSDIQSYVVSRTSLMDRYLLMQTGENQYTALVYDPVLKTCTQYRFDRVSSGSGGYYYGYTVTESAGTWDYRVTNDLYVFSNTDIGRRLDRPIVAESTAFALVAMLCVLTFAVLFKGVLFRCLRKRR